MVSCCELHEVQGGKITHSENLIRLGKYILTNFVKRLKGSRILWQGCSFLELWPSKRKSLTLHRINTATHQIFNCSKYQQKH